MIDVVNFIRNSAVRGINGSYIKHRGFLSLLDLFIFSMACNYRFYRFVCNVEYFRLVIGELFFFKLFFNPMIKPDFFERNFMGVMCHNFFLPK